MCEERAKTRCVQCELVQWADRAKCRRCGRVLPAPVVNVVERVVEKLVFHPAVQCLENLQAASSLISAAAMRLQESHTRPLPVDFDLHVPVELFPTLDEMERAMIMAAYRKCNRRPVEAARLLGIGKTTFYRKLREIQQLPAPGHRRSLPQEVDPLIDHASPAPGDWEQGPQGSRSRISFNFASSTSTSVAAASNAGSSRTGG